MEEVSYSYGLMQEWMHAFAAKIKGEIMNDKMVIIPENMGHGYSYLTQITPYLSALYMDFVPKIPIQMKRIKSNEELYIFHYDLSENFNAIKIDDTIYKTGFDTDANLFVVDNKIDSTLKPAVNKRIVTLRLLIDKTKMDFFLNNQSIKTNANQKFKIPKKSLSYSDVMDSKSKFLVHSIKEKQVSDLSFEPYLQGISLKLLANFLARYQNLEKARDKLSPAEIRGIIKTKHYLSNNLYEPFPTIAFLSKIAGMSVSKYKILFKRHLHTTPQLFFVQEKFILAKKLLQSGNYNSIREIMLELNYTKLDYFKKKYYTVYNRKVTQDFIQKNH